MGEGERDQDGAGDAVSSSPEVEGEEKKRSLFGRGEQQGQNKQAKGNPELCT